MRCDHRHVPQARARRIVAGSLLCALAIAPGLTQAQDDCLSGFHCGRVAWIEHIDGGPNYYRLWMQDVDGTQRTPVLDFGPGNANFAQELVFGPGSRRLYFTASVASSFDSNVMAINADGTGLVSLSNNDCSNSDFALSADGTRVAWVRNCGPFDTSGRVWVMDADGGNQRLLTTAPIVSDDKADNAHESPRFSPTGDRIVFTSREASTAVQHVYIASLDGQVVNAVTNAEDDGFGNFAPMFTPDGRVVYTSRGPQPIPGDPTTELYRIDADGSDRLRLTTMPGRKRAIAVSPDGSRVLFTNDRDTETFEDGLELHLVGIAGTGLVTLHDASPLLVGRAQFSPDGAQVMFELRGFGGAPLPSTVVVGVDGTGRTEYADPGEGVRFQAFGRPDVDGDGVIDGADSCPAQPNGYRVAIASNRAGNYDIWTTDFNGGAPRRLTTASAIDQMPRFDATGQRIVFVSNRFSSRNEIFAMAADGTGVRRLTNAAGNNITPAFSPDGARIVFIASRDGGQRNVWIMDADGGNALQLTTNQGFSNTANNPVFSPDGERIAFDSDRVTLGTANHDIFAIRPDGSEEIRLTTAPGRDIQPSYSPDGRRIVFISFRDGAENNGEIYVMDADGANPLRLTNGRYAETEPTFTPDGAQIVFRSDDDGTPQVYVMNRDGTGRRPLTRDAGFNTNPTVAPQPDRDADGVGDECDDAFDAATAAGTEVRVDGPGGTTVVFPVVSTAGTTTLRVIDVSPGDLPAGFTLCETCTAYDITTTASYTPPILVCLAVPADLATAEFEQLRLLHGEEGTYVDRTAYRLDPPGGPRLVCGSVTSLSPFVLATPAPAPEDLFADGFESAD